MKKGAGSRSASLALFPITQAHRHTHKTARTHTSMHTQCIHAHMTHMHIHTKLHAHMHTCMHAHKHTHMHAPTRTPLTTKQRTAVGTPKLNLPCMLWEWLLLACTTLLVLIPSETFMTSVARPGWIQRHCDLAPSGK